MLIESKLLQLEFLLSSVVDEDRLLKYDIPDSDIIQQKFYRFLKKRVRRKRE